MFGCNHLSDNDEKQLSSNIPDAVYNISVFIPANEPNVTSLW